MTATAPNATDPSPRVLTPLEATALPSGPILRTFFTIARAWRLSREQSMILLGLQAASTYSNWKRDPDEARLRPDTIERVSHVFGIHAALRQLIADPAVADSWVQRPNDEPLFGGRTAIERMTSGYVTDLARVREYLDALVHGGR